MMSCYKIVPTRIKEGKVRSYYKSYFHLGTEKIPTRFGDRVETNFYWKTKIKHETEHKNIYANENEKYIFRHN